MSEFAVDALKDLSETGKRKEGQKEEVRKEGGSQSSKNPHVRFGPEIQSCTTEGGPSS